MSKESTVNVSPIAYRPVGQFEDTRFEKIHNVIVKNSLEGSIEVAKEIASLIREKQAQHKPCVLGLATGSSPIKVYAELVRMHKEEGLSFANVITFNLDEYYPMQKDDIQSYYYFMHQYLFDHVDIKPENVNIPSGTVAHNDIRDFCHNYDRKIDEVGGLDFQLLGIGRTGHIGFNEPGSHFNSRTRDITLDHITLVDAAPAFRGLENVPRKAITMGIGTIRKAKRIVLLAWGENKSEVVKETIEGQITSEIPATYLQEHDNTTFVLDVDAASNLTRIDTPWLVGGFEWDKDLTHKAIIWLSLKLKKPVLQLTDKDYNDWGMSDLLSTEPSSSYDLNIKTFNRLQHTITGWPGGKPQADDANRPERAVPAEKRVLVFSPHPDDDVISMGGTLDRLVSQNHEVHVAYQTSGNISVADEDALRYAEIAQAVSQNGNVFNEVIESVKQKKVTDYDSTEIRKLKSTIRRYESLGATRFLGLEDSKVHFLNLPFYETGTIKKNPVGPEDVAKIKAIIQELKPHQIYAAGDLADPHGTHRLCLDALTLAIEELKNEPYMQECWVWLYSGAWHQFDIHKVDMAVPMSPDQVLKKRKAIFYHQTQKDGVMYQGEDLREFWVRAEDRNKESAQKFRDLGLANYAAIEAFKRYKY